MFMRYLGGGIGHQNQDTRWTSKGQEDNRSDSMDIDGELEEEIQTEQDMEDNQHLQLEEVQKLALQTSIRPAEEADKDIDVDSDNTDDTDSNLSAEDNIFNHGEDDESDTDESDNDELYFGPEDESGEDEDNGFGKFWTMPTTSSYIL